MLSTEFRKGNIVSNEKLDIFKTGYVELEARWIYELAVKESAQAHEDYVDYFKPIPISEDWLILFGFEEDAEYDNTFNLLTDVLNGFTTITIDVRAEVLLLDCMEIKIKHVHQLQNLYFSLTNQELKINQ